MPRYIDEKDVYALVEPIGIAKVHCSQIDVLPRADVVPKSEVEKIFETIEKLATEGGVIWTNYARAVLNELKKNYIEQCPSCKHFVGCEEAIWVRHCDQYKKQDTEDNHDI